MSIIRTFSLSLAVVAAAAVVAHAQPHAAELAAPASVPVGLSTRKPDVEWGTTERAPEKVSTTRGGGADAAAGADPNAKVDVRGLKGTLNRDDVHQTMDARQRALNQCTQRARQTSSGGLGYVTGQLRYAFRVDAEGRISELRPLSSVGHYELEQCVTHVVQETRFPKPAGRAAAEFTWGMSVEPASARGLGKLRASAIAPSLRKHKQELKRQCDLPRRARLRVTAYVSTSGQVLSSGAIATPAATQAAVPCVLEQLAKWQLPKPKRVAKISFDLR